VGHDSLALLRQRLYQIVAGYEDTNDADRLRHDRLLQIVADEKLGNALEWQPTLSRWENSARARDLVRLSDICLSSSSVFAVTRSVSAGRSCSISTPPTIPPTANNNSAFSTVPTASTCIIPYSSSSATPDAGWQRACARTMPPAMPSAVLCTKSLVCR